MFRRGGSEMATDMKMLIAEHFDALVRQRGIDKVTVKAVI